MKFEIIKKAEQAKRKPNILVACVLVFLFVLLGGIPGLFVNFGDNAVMNTAIGGLMLPFAGASFLCFIYVILVEKRPISTLGFFKPQALQEYAKGLGLGFVVFALIVLMASVSQGMTVSMNLSSVHWPSIMIIFIGFVVQGGTEEILFRGWMLPILGARYNWIVAVVVSSLGFTLLHGMNPGITALPLLNLTLFGLFAAIYTLYKNNLWGICAFHSVWNWAQGSVFGIKVSGTMVPGGTMFLSTPIEGKALLSGGSFGMEGSIFCTIVLIGLSIVYYMKLKRKEVA